MAAKNGYPAKGSIGYPTPGSMGTWAGIDRKIAMITLELPDRACRRRLLANNRERSSRPCDSTGTGETGDCTPPSAAEDCSSCALAARPGETLVAAMAVISPEESVRVSGRAKTAYRGDVALADGAAASCGDAQNVALRERVKELTCLYSLAQFSEHARGCRWRRFSKARWSSCRRRGSIPEMASGEDPLRPPDLPVAGLPRGEAVQSARLVLGGRRAGTIEVIYRKSTPLRRGPLPEGRAAPDRRRRAGGSVAPPPAAAGERGRPAPPGPIAARGPAGNPRATGGRRRARSERAAGQHPGPGTTGQAGSRSPPPDG